MHVPAVPNLQERLIYTYQSQRLFLVPNFAILVSTILVFLV